MQDARLLTEFDIGGSEKEVFFYKSYVSSAARLRVSIMLSHSHSPYTLQLALHGAMTHKPCKGLADHGALKVRVRDEHEGSDSSALQQ